MSIRSKKNIRGLLIMLLGCLVISSSAIAQEARDEYALAANHYSRGNWEESITAFRDLIQNHPNTTESVSAQFFLAEVRMQQGEFGQAFHAFQIFLQQHPENENAPRATFRMGEAAYRTGKTEIALRVLEDFVKSNPHHELNEFALPYLGEIRLKRDEPQLAQRAFETALKMFPASQTSNSSRLGLAKSLHRIGSIAEALRFYQFLITQPDRNLYGESRLQLGIISFGNVDYEAAEFHLAEAIANCNSEFSQAEATYWLARTYNEEENYPRAIELLKTIVNDNLPESLAVAVLFDGAISANRTGQDRLALRWLDQVGQRYPENDLADEAMGMSIEILKRLGDTDELLILSKRFRGSYKDSPLRASVLESEGRAHYAAHRYAKTIETFGLLLQENQDLETATPTALANWHYLKSLGHLGLGDFDQAESELSQIDGLAQSDQLKPLVQIALATARYGAENYPQAIENYRSYLQLAPTDAEQKKRARTELTICLAETSRWAEAAAAFDDLNSHHEQDPVVISTVKFLAERAYSEKQIDHAERWFTLMAEPENDHDTVARGLSGLAWIKMETSDAQSAYDVFERLLNECPDSKFSSEAAMARAKFLEDQQDFDQAAQTYGLVVRQFGNLGIANVAKLRRAYSLQKLGGQFNLQESKTLLMEYLDSPNGNPLADEALYQLGWVLHDLGEPDQCLARFEELVDIEPESKYWPDAAYRVIQARMSEDKIDQASTLISRLLSRNDSPPQVISRVLFIQGQIAAQENHWPEVTRIMEDLIDKTDDPKLNAKAQYWLAESFYRQERYDDGRAAFERLQPAVNQLDPKLEPWVLLRSAQCCGYQSDWIQAVQIANEAKSKFPNFEAGYEFDYILGRGLEDEGKLSDARTAYQLVLESQQGGSTETAAIAQWRIGETFFHQEQYRDAIKAYHRVDSLFSYAHWRSAALIQAGKCQEHLHNNQHALKLYTQLLENFPETEFAKDAKLRIAKLTEIDSPMKQVKSTGQSRTFNQQKAIKNQR